MLRGRETERCLWGERSAGARGRGQDGVASKLRKRKWVEENGVASKHLTFVSGYAPAVIAICRVPE